MTNLDEDGEPMVDPATEITFYGSYDHAGNRIEDDATTSNERSVSTFQLHPMPADTSNPYLWSIRRGGLEPGSGQDDS